MPKYLATDNFDAPSKLRSLGFPRKKDSQESLLVVGAGTCDPAKPLPVIAFVVSIDRCHRKPWSAVDTDGRGTWLTQASEVAPLAVAIVHEHTAHHERLGSASMPTALCALRSCALRSAVSPGCFFCCLLYKPVLRNIKRLR